MEKYTHSSRQSEFLYEEEKPLDLKALFYRYILGYWYLYLMGILLGLAGAWLYLRYATPMYVAKATILIKDESGTTGASQEALFKGLGISQGVESVVNEIQILKSRTLMEEVVTELGLVANYIQIARVKELEVYARTPVKLIKISDNQRKKILLLNNVNDKEFKLIKGDSATLYAYDIPVVIERDTFVFKRNKKYKFTLPLKISIKEKGDIAAFYASILNIREAREWGSVLNLTLKDAVPQRATDILNTLVKTYNHASIEDKNIVSANTLKFIEDRLLLISDELQGVEQNVEDYRRKNSMIDPEMAEASAYLEGIDELDGKLTTIEVEQKVLVYIEDYFIGNRGKYNLLPANLTVEDPIVSNHIADYNKAILERNRLLRSAGVENPALLEIERRIAALEGIIDKALSRLKMGVQETKSSAQNQIKVYQKRLNIIPRKQRELLEITRQQRIKENLYVYLLEKREETALSLAVATENSRLIDSARLPKRPVSPRRMLAYVVGFVLGLGLPILFVLLKMLLNDKIETEEDIKGETSTPILGGIAESKKGKALVVGSSARSAVAEMFRLLRTNLHFLAADKTQKCILISSGSGGEGKTFITLNTAMSMAISGKKTIAIGLDLRKPKLASYIGSQNQGKGISTYLVGEASKEEIILPTDLHKNFYYINAGPIPPNPAELLMQDRLDDLMKYLKTEFDVIFLDTPPVGLVTDALLLNRFVDVSLFVVRLGQTQKGVLRVIDDIYKQKKLNNPAIVMNGLNTKRGYGDRYGYGYGYYEK